MWLIRWATTRSNLSCLPSFEINKKNKDDNNNNNRNSSRKSTGRRTNPPVLPAEQWKVRWAWHYFHNWKKNYQDPINENLSTGLGELLGRRQRSTTSIPCSRWRGLCVGTSRAGEDVKLLSKLVYKTLLQTIDTSSRVRQPVLGATFPHTATVAGASKRQIGMLFNICRKIVFNFRCKIVRL